MPSLRRRASVIDADRVDEPPRESEQPADAADALALAEEAEAEAAEAEAVAAAARARARAIRLRRQAQAASAEPAPAAEEPAEVPAVELTEPSADVSEGAAEPTKEEHEPVRDRRRSWVGVVLGTIAAVVAFLCTAALIVLSLLMFRGHQNQVADQQRSAEYTAAARQSVVTLMSLDFNKAKEDVQRIIDNSTGQFRDDFKNQADDFVKVAQDSKVITEVTVNATGVESMTPDTAVVLVSATSRVTNAAGAKQEPRSWRLSVNLRRDNGQIKMEKVEFVP